MANLIKWIIELFESEDIEMIYFIVLLLRNLYVIDFERFVDIDIFIILLMKHLKVSYNYDYY